MKLKTLVLATSMALSAMSVAGTAQAGALATSVLSITDFTISQNGGLVDVGDFVPGSLAITNTTDITATLNGVSSVDSANGTGEDLLLAPVSQGIVVPAYADDSFAVIPNPPQSTFSLADQAQTGSPISGVVVDGVPIGTPGTASHSAYVNLEDEADGSSAANNGLNTTFTFALGEGGSLDFAFNARAYLEAFTQPDEVSPTGSSAAYSLIFAIEDFGGAHGGGPIVMWEPGGPTGGAATGIMNENDPFDLNDAISRNAPANGVAFRGLGEGVEFAGSWSATTIPLLANNEYQLTIRSTSEADAIRTEAVPEPATLALMGLGILGLGLSRRRRA